MGIDIEERLTAFANLGASWVMWLLVLLSIIGVAIVLERLYFFFSARDDLASLRSEFLGLLEKGDRKGAVARLAQSKSIEARIVQAGVEASDRGPAAAEERMTGEAALAKLAMERNIVFLGTVGANAPFVGLLGTVIGVINAFQELDASQGQVTSGLMAEIGEALVATAIGLLVALPAVAFFNGFQRVIRARLTRGTALGNELMALLKGRRGEGGGDDTAAPVAEPAAAE
jgi:biopolymer transport protein ExbB